MTTGHPFHLSDTASQPENPGLSREQIPGSKPDSLVLFFATNNHVTSVSDSFFCAFFISQMEVATPDLEGTLENTMRL